MPPVNPVNSQRTKVRGKSLIIVNRYKEDPNLKMKLLLINSFEQYVGSLPPDQEKDYKAECQEGSPQAHLFPVDQVKLDRFILLKIKVWQRRALKITLSRFCRDFSHPNFVWEARKAIQAGKRKGRKFNNAIDLLKREIKSNYTGKSQHFFPPYDQPKAGLLLQGLEER